MTHIIVESRGKIEDQDLESTFRKLSYAAWLHHPYPFDIRFASKKTNSCGLQIADLVAHPIVKHIVRKDQPNKAFEIVREKIFGYPKYEENGLRSYSTKNEMPQTKLGQDADRELPIHAPYYNSSDEEKSRT